MRPPSDKDIHNVKPKMYFSNLMLSIYNAKSDDIGTYHIYGYFGAGKTSYALRGLAEVYGSWEIAEKHLFFDPNDAIKFIKEKIRKRKRIPAIILDDAGLWLPKQRWWEKRVVAFNMLFQISRGIVGNIIFTTPSDDLPKFIKNKIAFRVKIVRKPNGWSSAQGYLRSETPSFKEYVRKTWYEIFPTFIPDDIYQKYKEKRREAQLKALEEWEKAEEGNISDYFLERAYMRPDEVAELVGVSKNLVYKWIYRGKIEAKKIKAKWWIPLSEAQKILSQ